MSNQRKIRTVCVPMLRTIVAGVALLAATGAIGQADTRPEAVLGQVIVARAAGDALVLWDCTPRLVALERAKIAQIDILHTLEAEAVTAGQSRLNAVKAATTLNVRVIYHKTGDVSPTYGTATFAGVERLLTVTLPTRGLAAHAREWSTAFTRGQTPAPTRLVVTGKLPTL